MRIEDGGWWLAWRYKTDESRGCPRLMKQGLSMKNSAWLHHSINVSAFQKELKP